LAKNLTFEEWVLIDFEQKSAWLAQKIDCPLQELLDYHQKKSYWRLPHLSLHERVDFFETERGQLELVKLKAAWRSYKHSQKHGSSQLTIITKKSTIKKFDKLARQQKMNRTEYLELLVDLQQSLHGKQESALLQKAIEYLFQQRKLSNELEELKQEHGKLIEELRRCESTALDRAVALIMLDDEESTRQLVEAIEESGGIQAFKDRLAQLFNTSEDQTPLETTILDATCTTTSSD